LTPIALRSRSIYRAGPDRSAPRKAAMRDRLSRSYPSRFRRNNALDQMPPRRYPESSSARQPPETEMPAKGSTSQKLINEIADKIQARIVAGDYPPGSRLKQETLAQDFAVSRTPIREALSHLEAKGIVSQDQGRSAVVRTPSSRDIAEMYQVRAELEGLAAQLAARWITDQQLLALRMSHDSFVKAVDDLRVKRKEAPTLGARVKLEAKAFQLASVRWIETNAMFHKTISESSNNRFLDRTLQDMASGYARTVMLSSALAMNSYRLDENIVQHERILKALEDREPAKARRAMVDHIVESEKFVIASFADAPGRR
jgi:DNA-binding GntR family transcriptional regulator